MPRRRDEQALITELEVQRKRIEAKIRDTRNALATRQANERAAQRAAHEAAMIRVIKRYSFEGATPDQLELALRTAGLKLRGKTEAVQSVSKESTPDALTMKTSTPRKTLKLHRTKEANTSNTLPASGVTG